ncbi:hypothetical protein J3F83DRAFT_588436 [Trichoderma novae-zelandiae]
MDRETIEIDLTASGSESSASGDFDPEVEYDEWKEEILDCLDSIKSSGDFSVCRTYTAHINPCLRIVGRETAIPLPLTDHDAETIRGACREAPFGKGDETLVDTSVRKTWELDATRFECTNPSWPAFFNGILKDVAAGFGLPEVKAKPHKLLLYEKGSFFKRHKDSEKEAGMIATLVVCLPGIHRGGDVHLSFGPEKRKLATAPASRFDVTAMAWFSDLDHEVKPLEFGNRLVLTYKLFQPSGILQSAQFLFGQSQKVKSVLGRWHIDFSDRFMLAYPLDHLYTKSSLSMNNLKGRDRAVCHSLKEASAACGLYLTLAHLTRLEMDDCGGYFGSDDGSTDLSTIYSCDGAPIGSSCRVDESEILVPNFFEDRDPDSEDEAEFTGNESMPAFYRYHNTVAVLTPMNQLLHYLMTSGSRISNTDADNLLSMVEETFQQHRENPVVESSTLQVMTDILGVSHSSWRRTHFTVARWAQETNHDDLFEKAVQTLLASKDPKSSSTELPRLVGYLLDKAYAESSKEVNWKSIFGSFLQSATFGVWESIWTGILNYLKVKAVKDSLIPWAQSQLEVKLDTQESFGVIDYAPFIDRLGRLVEYDRILAAFSSRGTRELIFKVFESMFQIRDQYIEGTVKSIFETTLQVARSRLVLRWQDICAKGPGSSFSCLPDGDESRVLLRQFAGLIKQSLTVGASDQAIALVEECHKGFEGTRCSWDPSRCHKQSLVQDLLLPLASALYSFGIPPRSGVRGFFELLIRDVLHHQMPQYPEKPSGWRHKRRGCLCCEDCAALNAFLESEDQTSWSLHAAADRRKHIESHLPDSVFKKETISNTSPYILVVEKLGTEHREEVAAFRRKLEPFDSVLSPLQGDILRSILGEATYQEIVVLEHIRSGTTAAPVVGVKRPSDNDLAGDSVRQRV